MTTHTIDLDLRFSERQGRLLMDLEGPEGQLLGQQVALPHVPTRTWRLSVASARRAGRDFELATAGALRQDAVSLGRSLFSALFSSAGASGFLHEARSRCRREDVELLRIRLRIAPAEPHLRQVAYLPWELLHDGEDFLCLGRRVAIVRYLEMPTPQEPVAAEPPLKLLLVASSPEDLRRLDVESEGEGVLATWRSNSRIEADSVASASWEVLRDRMHHAPVHALHFMGHGAFDERSARGAIVLHAAGGHEAVHGEELRRLARDSPSLRLVVLNACDTGKFDPAAGAEVFAGAAIALAQGGVSAVIGMQIPIADSAAVLFGQVLHQRLSQGERLELALAEARARLHRAAPEAWDWMAPVLFMRSQDGYLLKPSIGNEGRKAAPEPGSRVDVKVRDVRATGRRARVQGAEGQRQKEDRITVKVDRSSFDNDEIDIIGWTEKPRNG